MGAHPYWYFVPYEPDPEKALQALRRREFAAGRYNPVLPFIDFPVDGSQPGPGAGHRSIREAQEAADADGTRSILDIEHVGPEADFATAVRLDDAALEDLYETAQPTRAMVEENMDFFDELERGHGIYFAVYRDGLPDEWLFAGYSYD